MEIGTIRSIKIEDEMRDSYLEYAMSVIVSRALPDVRDGLKPVHRRILYSMHELGLTNAAKYRKSATVVGDVLGKYHPHGDTAVYDALVRMAQDFNMRYMLVDGQGNFGSVDGDPPAAMRYTECRMAAIADELLADIEKNTVDFYDNFDGTRQQPTVLPSRFPNLLVNGSTGIAVGMATNIPPHNLGEISAAIKHMIGVWGSVAEAGVPFDLVWSRGFGEPPSAESLQQGLSRVPQAIKDRMAPYHPGKTFELLRPDEKRDAYLQAVDEMTDVSPDDLMKFVKGPDFPTHGLILGVEGIKQAYTTGHGRILMRARTQIEEPRAGRFQIIVTELPYAVNKANLVEKIADLVREKKIEGIAELRDESDRQGMRIVMELKREAKPKTLLNQLYKHTSMQQAFSMNTLALVDGQPRVLTLKMVLQQFLRFRREVITRRTQFELDKAQARLHILAGLKIALDHLDEVINTIRAARDRPTAGKDLMAKFGLSEAQTQAILDMALGRLAALERQKIIDEYNEIEKLVKKLEDLLAHPLKILYVARDETEEIAKKYSEPRRTRIIEQEVGDFSEEDLIPDEEVAVTVSSRGYIKRLPIDTYRVQRRGGRGVTGMVTREDDAVEHILVASTHDSLLFFTDRGRVYQTRTHELPDASRQARGLPLINLINIDPKERVTGFAVVKTFDPDRFFVMGTRKGEIKRVSVSDFASVRPSGLIAMDLDGRDELVWVRMTSGNDDVFLVTMQGQAIRFSEKEVRASNRGSGGVRGISLEGEDRVIALDVVGPKGGQLIVASKRGFGKRTDVAEFPRHARGGKGVRAQLVTDKTGPIAAARVIQPADDLMMISEGGIVIRTEISTISQLGRAAQGVMLMRLGAGDSLVAFTRIEAPTSGEVSPTRRTTRRGNAGANGHANGNDDGAAPEGTAQLALPADGAPPNGDGAANGNGNGARARHRPSDDGAGNEDK